MYVFMYTYMYLYVRFLPVSQCLLVNVSVVWIEAAVLETGVTGCTGATGATGESIALKDFH